MTVDRIVVGLGNPGARYRSTRHNLGFGVIERLASRLGAGAERSECGALVRAAQTTLLACPQTYMNRSGMAVRCLLDLHGVDPARTLVVFDDVALPLGRLRARAGGGAGGHRGVESIIESVRTEAFPRLRIGIASAEVEAGIDLAEYVLRPFPREQAEEVAGLVERASDAVLCWIEEGIESVMNRFNG